MEAAEAAELPAAGEAHPLDAGSILSSKPVRLFPSLFAHRRPTVFIDYPPFVGASRPVPSPARRWLGGCGRWGRP
jgi:hypothetical protein